LDQLFCMVVGGCQPPTQQTNSGGNNGGTSKKQPAPKPRSNVPSISTRKGCGAQRIALATKGLVSIGIGVAKVGLAVGSAALVPETGGVSAVGVAYGVIGAAGNFTAGGAQLAGALTGEVNTANQAADVAATVTTLGGAGVFLITGDMEKASLAAGAESLFTAGYSGGATGHVIDEAATAFQKAMLSTELGTSILDAVGLSGTDGCPQ